MAQVPYERMPSTLNEQGHGMTVAVQNPRKNVSLEKYKNTLGGMGYAELVLGITSVGLGVFAIIIDHTSYDAYSYRYYTTFFSDVAQGIWCGAFLIVSGILGIKVSRSPSRCMYNANMVLCILTSCAMAVLVIMSSLGAAFGAGGSASSIIHGILAVLGFAGMIICIVHSAYCCAGVCCMQNTYQGIMVCGPQQCFGAQQMVQLPNGQFAMISSQGAALQGYPHGAAVVSPPIGALVAHPQQMQASQSQVPDTATAAQTFSEIPKTEAMNPLVNPENPPIYTEFPQ